MAQEIEVKFPLQNRQELTRKLHELGAQRLYPETFEDNIVLDRRGELRTKGALLRVRKFGKYALATFKGPMSIEAGGIKTREEVQTGVSVAASNGSKGAGIRACHRGEALRQDDSQSPCAEPAVKTHRLEFWPIARS